MSFFIERIAASVGCAAKWVLIFGLIIFLSGVTFAAPVPGRAAHDPERISLSLSGSETAVFAGGHYWPLEKFFAGRRKQGVISTITGSTDHFEAVELVFNPKRLTYEKLVEDFLHQIDPFDHKGQFCDRGDQYRSAIFYESEKQRLEAKSVIQKLEKRLGKGKFATELLPAKAFYAAQPIDQDFFASNPVSYKLYLFGCGREERLKAVWGAK